MEYKIEYNRALELIASVYKYGIHKMQQVNWNSKDFQGDSAKGLLDFSPSKDVKEWLNYVDDNVSPFFMNNILFIVSKFPGVLDFCFELVIIEKLNEPQELIEVLKEVNGMDIIHEIFQRYNLDIPLESDNEEIKSVLTNLYSAELASLFIQIKNHSEEFKNEILEVFKIFYELYYLPFEKKVCEFMEKRCMKHNNLFQKDPTYFLNTIGLGDYSKIVAEEKKLRLFVSFFIDLGFVHYYIDDTFIMEFGHYIEPRFNNRLTQEKCKTLFKALSDEKRLEIIKVTSERPWYNKELADYFNLTTATLSYHLNLLLELGILNFEPSISNRYYYTTNKENLKKMLEMAYNEIVG
ncbi:hypothetical protein DW1_0680 [Proteiniborus sp. DW1]|uniref:ArsR family transcriptional regulator n=1 Tax=Proteiniborus sp. DW1 TaxID=1889883 RepID=UPI00092E1DEB|nr:ArsR family transcriptional regulator [Proteiniborus sp. DW1]SCG82289.1 hypothetical protein DW1_0680 [Proteiniborus sp. DW1]